eukprot:CAMPEP_0175661668 /NCGR_PEP_ID=MMETSP0097-20121207/15075_1 /TAXON_ID=311494 /ORGANISM="Alexandrium monilatum, Strain CCMP3105" /LENGTH=208 /DNA_ID=CAMNT_0016967843 /DNA_START=46 /DNA_END=672 /DNA_ORIENTATION=-
MALRSKQRSVLGRRWLGLLAHRNCGGCLSDRPLLPPGARPRPVEQGVRKLLSESTFQLRRKATPRIVDIGGDAPTGEAPQAELPAEELRAVAAHPQMASLQVQSGEGRAVLRRREVVITLPLSELQSRMRDWGWEGQNCHRPLLLFGDDEQEVLRAYNSLVEEGFTAVSNAWTREAVLAALRRPPAHLRSASNQGGGGGSEASTEGAG